MNKLNYQRDGTKHIFLISIFNKISNLIVTRSKSPNLAGRRLKQTTADNMHGAINKNLHSQRTRTITLCANDPIY